MEKNYRRQAERHRNRAFRMHSGMILNQIDDLRIEQRVLGAHGIAAGHKTGTGAPSRPVGTPGQHARSAGKLPGEVAGVRKQ